MTTGHEDYSDVPGTNINTISFVGKIHYVDWNGGDRAPRAHVPKPPPYTIYRDGKTFTFRPRRVGVHPPPYRASSDQHDYWKVEKRSTSESVTVVPGVGPPVTGNTAAAQSGTGFNSGYITTSLYDANDQIKVVNRLREKLQGSEFNASIFLGEGHQTLRMLADSAIRIRKSLTHLRRGDLSGSARSLLEGTSRSPLKPYSSMKQFNASNNKTIANNWLELQYGWLPLLKDSYALGEAIAHRLSEPLEMKFSASLRKSKSTEGVPSYLGYYQMFPGDPIGRYFFYCAGARADVTLRTTVFIKERPSLLAEMGLTDPSQVLWEVLPWSFVADWFIPVGNYLEARGTASVYPGVYCTSILHKGKNHPVRGYSNTNGAGTLSSMSLDGYWPTTRGHAEHFSYSRTYASAPRVPLPSFKPLAKIASWQHCANAVALLTSRFAGKTVVKTTPISLVKGRTAWYQGRATLPGIPKP